MKAFGYMVILTSLSFAPLLSASEGAIPTDISLQMKPETVKVLLSDKQTAYYLDVTGPHKIYNPATGILIADEKRAKSAVISLTSGGIHWKETYPSILQMRLVPSDSSTSIVINGIQYKGCLELYEVGGKLAVVNEVDAETFLKQTLSKEKIPTTDKELLNCVAIVARTNLYYHLSQNKGASWHYTAKELSYDGQALIHQNYPVEKALDATHYVIMTYQNQPFATTWSVDSAGTTASYSSIFRKNTQGPKGITFAAAQKNKEERKWKFTLSKEELAQKLQTQEIATLDLFIDQTAGKVYGIKAGSPSNFKSMDFFSFQKAVGVDKLKSNDFHVVLDKDKVTFEGFGQGNGVGLCLYSAKLLADHGKTAAEILKTFYPGAKLESIKALSPSEKKL